MALVFASLQEAESAGYIVLHEIRTGYVVRKRVDGRWKIAFVDVAL